MDTTHIYQDCPGGAVVKYPPANVGDSRNMGSIPGLGRSPGEGNGNPLQYSYLENSMDREAWWAIATRVRHNWSQLIYLSISYMQVPCVQAVEKIEELLN